MRIFILGGAGAMGSETTKDIVSTGHFSEIAVGDIAVERTKEFISKIKDERLSVVKVDANNIDEIVEAIKGFDIVACALPFKYDFNVTKACIRAKVNGIDLSSNESQFALDDEAREAGITYIAGCGATPGTTNIMAKYGINKLDSAEKVEIAFAAFRSTAIAPGLLYTTLWEFDPDVEERAYFENGEFIRVKPFRTMVKYDFYQKQPIEVNGDKVKPVDFMFNFLLQNPEAKKNPVWAYGLVVEVVGKKGGKPAKISLKNSHPPMESWGGKSAYGKNVGIPLSIGAQMIARGKAKGKGVLPPEASLDAMSFFNELSKRGIKIGERMESYVGRNA